MMVRWVRVAAAVEVPAGGTLAVQAEDHPFILTHVEGKLHCIYGLCPHQGRGMASGCLEGKLFTCPWHAWVFDVTTGKSPFTDYVSVPTFPVRVEGEDVMIGLPPVTDGTPR